MIATEKRVLVCKRGHDLTADGALSAQGKCKECVKITSREIRAEIRAGNFSRMRKPICKHGHDKRVVGISPNGGCKECYRIRTKRSEAGKPWAVDPSTINFRNPICPKGHDKRIVGVNKQYSCMECQRQISKTFSLNLRRRQAGFDGDPQKVPNLKAIRLGFGLTAEEMAARIGLSIGGYNHLENERRTAGRRTLAKIVRAVDELMHTREAGRVKRGRYRRLLGAMAEAERGGAPTAAAIGRVLGQHPTRFGVMLKYAHRYGFAERAQDDGGVRWTLTDKGRRVLGGAA